MPLAETLQDSFRLCFSVHDFASSLGGVGIVEGVELSDAWDEGVVCQCGNTSIDLGAVDSFDVHFHGGELVLRVGKAHHVDSSAEVSVLGRTFA